MAQQIMVFAMKQDNLSLIHGPHMVGESRFLQIVHERTYTTHTHTHTSYELKVLKEISYFSISERFRKHVSP